MLILHGVLHGAVRLLRFAARLAVRAVRSALMGLGCLTLVLVAADPGPVRRELERRAYRLARWVTVAPPPSPAPLDGAPPIVWPVDSERVSSGFGTRIHPLTRRRQHHRGVDIPLPVGTPVRSAVPGTVTQAAEDTLNGRHVVVESDDGVRTAYCHLDAVEVRTGATVGAGQRLGRSGNTGRSTGPHLHFGTWYRGRAVDPRRFGRAPAPSGS